MRIACYNFYPVKGNKKYGIYLPLLNHFICYPRPPNAL
jgi:hypothetical protein